MIDFFRARWRTVRRSIALRLAFVFTFIFAICATLLAAILYLTIETTLKHIGEQRLHNEVVRMKNLYRHEGLGEMEEYLASRALEAGMHYRVIMNGHVIFDIAGPIQEKGTRYYSSFMLTPKLRMELTLHTNEAQTILSELWEVAGWGVLLTLILALSGGFFAARQMLSSVSVINNTALAIRAGQLKKRVPLQGSGDELDELSATINAMLDDIAHLIDEIKTVMDGVAHELRSPLTRLRTRLEMALIKSETADAALAEMAIYEVDRVLRTLRRLLDLAEMEAGVFNSQLESIDIASLLEDMATLFTPLFEEKQLRFEQRIAGHIMVLADRDLLGQAVFNLLENAAKYADRPGTVRLSAHRRETCVCITVEDSGPGIPDGEKESIFQRFYRGTHTNMPGNGLGLPLVRIIAQMHQGKIHLHDSGLGGAAFTLCLPVQH